MKIGGVLLVIGATFLSAVAFRLLSVRGALATTRCCNAVPLFGRQPESARSDTPLACLLSAQELAERKAISREMFGRLMREVQETQQGYRIRFDATDEVIKRLSRWIDDERKCCRFLRFQVTVEPAQGPVWFDISGPEGTKELLRSVLDAKK